MECHARRRGRKRVRAAYDGVAARDRRDFAAEETRIMALSEQAPQDSARIVIETSQGRHEFVFEQAEVSTVTSAQVVVLLSNAKGERARAVLPKAMLRKVASLKLLW